MSLKTKMAFVFVIEITFVIVTKITIIFVIEIRFVIEIT